MLKTCSTLFFRFLSGYQRSLNKACTASTLYDSMLTALVILTFAIVVVVTAPLHVPGAIVGSLLKDEEAAEKCLF